MPEPFEHEVFVAAEPERVFAHFTDARALVRWMGDYAVVDPQPGGEFMVDINGVPVRGRFLEIDPPRRLVVSWGHAGSELLPPGSSSVEVTFEPAGDGTNVRVVHRGLPEFEATAHALGWPHFLARLALAGAGGDPGPDPWLAAPPVPPG